MVSKVLFVRILEYKFSITNIYLTDSVLLFTRIFYIRGIHLLTTLSNLSGAASYTTSHHPRLSVITGASKGGALSATAALEFPNWFQAPVTSGNPQDSSTVDIPE